MKATAIAPSNIAFIKYWGKTNEKIKLPENGSISMNLSNLTTTTTVEFNPNFKKDLVVIDSTLDIRRSERVVKHLDLIRKKANLFQKAKVVSSNNFPEKTGLSSSASAFAALTLAASKAAGQELSEKELSILARQGSGSACRSVPNGFVEWSNGKTTNTSYARSIYPENYWKIIDVVTIVSHEKKHVSSTEGQRLVLTSPFFQLRKANINAKIRSLKEFIKNKNFTGFGQLIEKEALELHAIMLTSTPPLIYWQPATLKIIKLIGEWRNIGLEVYFTINTGQNIHLIIEEKTLNRLEEKLRKIKEVKKIIINRPSSGAKIIDKHLF